MDSQGFDEYGRISEYDFRKLIKFDKVYEYWIDNGYSNPYMAGVPRSTLFSKAFFLNGKEIAYWNVFTRVGCILDEPREWDKGMLGELKLAT